MRDTLFVEFPYRPLLSEHTLGNKTLSNEKYEYSGGKHEGV
ncbi:hypothetical protein PPSQR21_031770 [Paenibacillus polymyxa SQR-21]|nr:hypothetical protein PPSQR21_031770 [Paenibacillus polymyxa SQR-21]